MKTQFVEATNGPMNWGRFCVAVFEPHELAVESKVDPGASLVRGRGWSHGHVLVLDLQTGEGATFKMGGIAKADLEKHKIWVCVLFERFLEWLYLQPDPGNLPATVDFPDVAFGWSGYRRAGAPDIDLAAALEIIGLLSSGRVLSARVTDKITELRANLAERQR